MFWATVHMSCWKSYHNGQSDLACLSGTSRSKALLRRLRGWATMQPL